MVAANRLFSHVSTIETETQIHLLGFSRTVEDLWADFRFEIRKSESRCNFDVQSSEESSSSRRIQRQTGWIFFQSPCFWKEKRYVKKIRRKKN